MEAMVSLHLGAVGVTTYKSPPYKPPPLTITSFRVASLDSPPLIPTSHHPLLPLFCCTAPYSLAGTGNGLLTDGQASSPADPCFFWVPSTGSVTFWQCGRTGGEAIYAQVYKRYQVPAQGNLPPRAHVISPPSVPRLIPKLPLAVPSKPRNIYLIALLTAKPWYTK